MAKLISISVIILSIALPIAMAESRNPKRSIKLIWISIVAFALLWAILCTKVYPLLVFPE